ncbi:MAG: hypothetical protein HQL20_04930, partial [Candidatus Omnitrophica bacterium]|nr:hypothetical protein [Candidatus Omnitrophota bacterium]
MGRYLALFLLWLFCAAGAQAVEPAVADVKQGSAGQAVGASDKLDYTLGTLKASVDRLSQENKRLAATNDQIRLRLRSLNDQLAAERAQAVKLDGQWQSLEPRYQARLAERVALESQLGLAGGDLDKLKAARTTAEEGLQVKEVEDTALSGLVNEVAGKYDESLAV